MAKYKTFPELIRWIADTYHDGVVDAIAPRAKISGALADKWVKGKVRAPTIATLRRLCSAYDLPLHEVMRVAYDLGKRGAALLLLLGGLLLWPHDLAHARSGEFDITKCLLSAVRRGLRTILMRWSGFTRSGFARIDSLARSA